MQTEDAEAGDDKDARFGVPTSITIEGRKEVTRAPCHPLHGVDLKLVRARELIQLLDASMREHGRSDAHEYVRRHFPDQRIAAYVLKVNRGFPPVWSAMIGEIVHNLRCALDYIVFQLIIRETGREPTGNKNQFPVFLNEAGFDSRGVPQMLQGVGATAQAFIRSVQPFAVGDGELNPLWVLSKLSNWDKHRSIALVFAMSPKHFVEFKKTPDIQGTILAGDLELRDGSILGGVKISPGPPELFEERAARVRFKVQGMTLVALGAPFTLPGNPAVQAALEFIGLHVRDVADRVEKEFFSG